MGMTHYIACICPRHDAPSTGISMALDMRACCYGQWPLEKVLAEILINLYSAVTFSALTDVSKSI